MKVVFITVALFLGASFAQEEEWDEDSQPHIQNDAKTSNSSCSCGTTNRRAQDRIVGGAQASTNEFPLIGAISADEIPSKILCGSTILTQRHALTAAHCFIPDHPLSVVLGQHSSKITEDSVRIPIVQFILHENYDVTNHSEYDIALLVLASNIPFSSTIGPACFPDAGIDVTGEFVKIIGWGKLELRGPRADYLQKVDVQVVPNRECAKIYEAIDDSVLCTYALRKDSCRGDSGGPVIFKDFETGRYTVVGIVSHGIGCAQPNTPAVNTNVAYFRDWILQKITETSPEATTCANTV